MFFYQNTFISPASPDAFAHRLLTATAPETKRRVFNNVCVYLNRYGWLRQYKGVGNDVQADGNLHWCLDTSVEVPDGFLDKVRNSKFSEANKQQYPPGWSSRSFVADPRLVKFDRDANAVCDYRLQENSPAIGAGIVLPDELEDPLRPKDGARPDIGALPRGAGMFAAGRLEDSNSIKLNQE